MSANRRTLCKLALVIAAMAALIAASTHLRADSGTCGGVTTTLPFMDVMGNAFFCQIAEAYFSGLTNGTSATTYSPTANVPREQMAAFITRTMDQSLRRGSRRAALDQWYTPTSSLSLAKTTLGLSAEQVKSDGADLWVPNYGSATVSRVRASDGKLLETWGAAVDGFAVLVARGRVYVAGFSNPGTLYEINPTQPAGNVTLIANTLGSRPHGIAFDGFNIWTANIGTGPNMGSVSRIDPVGGFVNTFTTGFNQPNGILYDGTNIWVTDYQAGTLLKLNVVGVILQTINVGLGPYYPIYDGTNIWVPNFLTNSVSVVRASTGAVLATLTGNGLDSPVAAAFDGERVLVTNNGEDSVSLWKAADLTPLGSFPTGTNSGPVGACSDGLDFWIVLQGTHRLARF